MVCPTKHIVKYRVVLTSCILVCHFVVLEICFILPGEK